MNVLNRIMSWILCILPLEPTGSVVGMPTGLTPVGVSDVISSLTSCRLVAVRLMSNLTDRQSAVVVPQACPRRSCLWCFWGFRVRPSGLESDGSMSDPSVCPLRFQSAESQSWGKGLYLPTGRGLGPWSRGGGQGLAGGSIG